MFALRLNIPVDVEETLGERTAGQGNTSKCWFMSRNLSVTISTCGLSLVLVQKVNTTLEEPIINLRSYLTCRPQKLMYFLFQKASFILEPLHQLHRSTCFLVTYIIIGCISCICSIKSKNDKLTITVLWYRLRRKKRKKISIGKSMHLLLRIV